MRRREFVAASLGGMLMRPRARRGSAQEEEWRFSLDDALRWSLARPGEEPVISRATIALELGGAPAFALGSLEEVRRIRSETRAGAVTLVVGRREAVEVTVQFEDGTWPRILVRVRGLDVARDLIAVRLVEGVPLARRTAWINGYESRSRCEVVRGTSEGTGHWQLALLNDAPAHRRTGAPSLAMVFGESDGSDGEFRVSGGRVAVVSRFGHRAVGAAHHPEWLLRGDHGAPLSLDERPQWGGRVYGLEAAQRGVQDYLRDLARHATQEWGYDVLDLGFLHYGAMGTRPERSASPHEALRSGLRALREGAGRAFLLGSGAPQQHALGLLDGMRTGGDEAAGWAGIVSAARAGSLREHLNGQAWYNWPGPLQPGPPLTTEEARAWASVVALWGGIALASGSLTELPDERLEILRKCVPPAPVRAGALGLALDGRGAGSPGSPTGDRAPPWIAARVRDDWWMVAAVNWDEEPRRMSAGLAALGVAGPVAVYDVWAEARRADIAASVSLTVQPHSATVLSLRRTRRYPFVLGTTRHVVQGALDLADERWDSRRRTLSGRSIRLDGRPYAITIAVPPSFHPRRCGTSAECSAVHEHRDGRIVRLEIAGTREDVEWEVGF